MIARMSRYTPKRLPEAQGGGPARPKKPFVKGKAAAVAKSPAKAPVKKFVKPGKFECPQCEKRFNTEEALATHAEAAHGTPIDPAKMSKVPESQVRCPVCGAPVRKRNLPQHLRFVHDTV